MLGKLQADLFPPIFGPAQDEPLDTDAVRTRFVELAARIGGRTPEEVAEGFLRVAVENMANAIKKISVERGHDVTAYTLSCFGGAGGQHACLVADALGMKTIHIHPISGLLSAYGIGLARIAATQARAVIRPFDDELTAKLDGTIAELTGDVRAELAAQGVDTARANTRTTLHLRYDGSDTTLPSDFTARDRQAAIEHFEAAHRAQFGFSFEGRTVMVEAVEVSAEDARRPHRESENPARASGAPEPHDRRHIHTGGEWHDANIYMRTALTAGHEVNGPAIVVEPNQTIVIEPGWRAEVTAKDHIVMRRVEPLPARMAIGTGADPVMLEIFNNRFMSIAEQMGAALQNTASSVNIKERLDFSCAVFDRSGGLVSNAPHMPATSSC